MPYSGRWVFTDVRLALWALAAECAAWALLGHSPQLAAAASITALAAATGLAALCFFHAHAARLVFNVPRRAARPARASLWALFKITRPLEMVWRLATAPCRDVPDLVILGEARCGTTTLGSQLKECLPGAQPPFCPWIHPLEEKESFYFVGHYFGLIHPYFYRAVYPLAVWRRVAQLRGKPYFTFDACAQYLNAPHVARYLHAAAPAARLVVCVRDPVEQATSWWRYEQAGMAWARDALGFGGGGGGGEKSGSGGVRSWRGPRYPPLTFADAFKQSRSAQTSALYKAAELLDPRTSWCLPYVNPSALFTVTFYANHAHNLTRSP
jgi:hypothetical protein